MSEAIFGLIGVFVGAGIAWLQAFVSEWRQRKRNARYLAIRVVCILDKYIEDCVEVACDNGHEGEDQIRRVTVSAPAVPAFPGDVDWRSIDHELMYRVLSLPRDAEAAAHIIQGVGKTGDGPPDYSDFFEERIRQYGRLGLQAFEAARKLRDTYTIPAKKYDDWNPVEHIKVELQRLQERQQAREAAHHQIFAEFTARVTPG